MRLISPIKQLLQVSISSGTDPEQGVGFLEEPPTAPPPEPMPITDIGEHVPEHAAPEHAAPVEAEPADSIA